MGNQSKTKIEKVKDTLKYHLVDTTAITATVTPIFAAFETTVAGFSDENSLNARLLGAVLNYVGFGRVFSKGLDVSRRLFKINSQTSEKVRGIHDAAYAIAYCGVIQPPFYYAAGVRDLNEIILGTAVGMGLALVVGGPLGYTIDAFRDLTGLEECERSSYPNLIKKQSSKAKKGLAALLTAGAIALTGGIYSLTANKQEPHYQQPPVIEQVMENSESH